jgi:pimeloyl-ACP methyl ester carboxylesterase
MPRIRIPQGEIEYREVGQGPPIVFVHGLLVDGGLWREVVTPLARSHRCIIPDWPLGSHRLPMAADADLTPSGIADIVAAFLEAIDLRGVTLVGNDTGGAVCQILCVRRPERVARLVLTNCDAFEVFPPSGFGYLRWIGRVPGLVWTMAKGLQRVPALCRSRIGYGALTRRPLPEELLRAWVTPAARQRGVRRDLGKTLRSLSPRYTMEAAAQLPGLALPTLIAWGRDDPFFQTAFAERLARTIPGARLELIEDAATFVPLDQPARLAAAIAAFLGAEASATTAKQALR